MGSTPLKGSSSRISFGIGDQGAGDFELPPFAAAEGVGFLISLPDQAVLVEQGVGPLRCAGGE